MSQEEVLNRVQELNNKFAEGTIKNPELTELFILITNVQEFIREEMYERKMIGEIE